jgi:hypothetical protein
MIDRLNPASALDALEADLLGASPEEVQAALRESGRARESAVGEIRLLVRDAEADDRNSGPLALPFDERDGMGTQRH